MSVTSPVAVIAELSDEELTGRVALLCAKESRLTAVLIAHSSEFDARRLYRAHACSSLFAYCVQVLHLSEHAAYGRIGAARAVRRFPILLDRLMEGSIHLSAVVLLAPHLTDANRRQLLDLASHRSTRYVEYLVASLKPSPPIADMIRLLPLARIAVVDYLPAGTSACPSEPRRLAAGEPWELDTIPAGGSTESAPSATSQGSPPGDYVLTRVPPPPSATSRRIIVAPLSPDRYRIQFTASADVYDKLRRAQALLRHQVPDGDLERIVDRALMALLDRLERVKFARRRGGAAAP